MEKAGKILDAKVKTCPSGLLSSVQKSKIEFKMEMINVK
jgi:hypothetical protein